MTAEIFKFESSSSGPPKCAFCGKPAARLIQLVNVDTATAAGGKWFCNDCDSGGPLTPAIAVELSKILKRLGADEDLLSIIGSYGDTLSDEEVLAALKDWNATWKVIHTSQ